MKLWAMPCRATQDGRVMVETKCGLLEEGMANLFSFLALRNPWTVWEDKKDRTLKAELSRSVGAQYATGEEWRNNSRKNEETEPKWKQCPVVDVTGDESKVRCCKEQYCIGTWKVHESREIESGQTGYCKIEHQQFRNQWTKMDRNGKI